MSSVTYAAKPVEDQHVFNLARWIEVLADPELDKLEGRVETDRYGNIVMSPPPSFSHSTRQTEILLALDRLIEHGVVRGECPLSTAGGMRGVDAVWASQARIDEGLRENVLVIAPEICVEVLSPRNRREEIEEKKRLYFEAGAEEVWLCDLKGEIFFYLSQAPGEAVCSRICPDFPEAIE